MYLFLTKIEYFNFPLCFSCFNSSWGLAGDCAPWKGYGRGSKNRLFPRQGKTIKWSQEQLCFHLLLALPQICPWPVSYGRGTLPRFVAISVTDTTYAHAPQQEVGSFTYHHRMVISCKCIYELLIPAAMLFMVWACAKKCFLQHFWIWIFLFYISF